MTAAALAYALPDSPSLPPGVAPGPAPLPAARRYVPPADPAPVQAGGYLVPGNTAEYLAELLTLRGIRHLFRSADAGLAVVSLPQVSVWVTPYELYWYQGWERCTWPATDVPGAAEHLGALSHSGQLTAPGGVPWETDDRP